MISEKYKLISCILPKGLGFSLIKSLKKERGIVTATLNLARGVGRLGLDVHSGVGDQTEKEMVNVTVAAEDAEEIFEFIYEEVGIDKPHGGLIFMSPLRLSTVYTLPDNLPQEQ